MRVNLHRAITSLTCALDFVGVDEVHHGKRVALMAAAIGDELGWEKARSDTLLYAGMIHDCGVSREREHRQLTATLEWEGAEEHCLRGEKFLLACRPLAHLATAVRWHHTRWEQLIDEAIDDEQRIAANLIFLTDRADVLLAPYFAGQTLKNDILWEYPGIVARLTTMSGSLFAPELVEAFRGAARRESFWLAMDPSYIESEVQDRLRDSTPVEVGTTDALAIAGLFARTVDAKSSYTLEHSTRVARIARHLAEARGSSAEDLDKVEIAALLHDIGKLRVPEEIIDKPGPLTPEERAFVMRHSYDTGHILRKVFPGQPIADWASMHHENLLGTGYPSRRPGAAIPPEARLIAVADIFQALSQERPYRNHLSRNAVMDQMDRLLAMGRLDAEMIELLRAHLGECYALAVD